MALEAPHRQRPARRQQSHHQQPAQLLLEGGRSRILCSSLHPALSCLHGEGLQSATPGAAGGQAGAGRMWHGAATFPYKAQFLPAAIVWEPSPPSLGEASSWR